MMVGTLDWSIFDAWGRCVATAKDAEAAAAIVSGLGRGATVGVRMRARARKYASVWREGVDGFAMDAERGDCTESARVMRDRVRRWKA